MTARTRLKEERQKKERKKREKVAFTEHKPSLLTLNDLFDELLNVNTHWLLTNVDACVQVAWLCCIIRGRRSTLMTSDPKSVNTLLALTNDDAYVQVALLCCVILGRRSILQVFGLRPEMTR